LGEVITEGASADLIIPNTTLDSVSTLVSLLYGGSSTVTHGVYAGLQSLCHSLGLKSWLQNMVTAAVQEVETTAAVVQQQMQPCDEDARNQQGQTSANNVPCSSPTEATCVRSALNTVVRRPTKSGIKALDVDEEEKDEGVRGKGSIKSGGAKGCKSGVGFQIVKNTDLKMTVVKEKPERRLRLSNEKTLRSITEANVKKPPNDKRKSSRTRSKQNFACQMCSTTSSSSQMLEIHYNRIHFSKLTRGDGRGGSLSTCRVRKKEDSNMNRKSKVETIKGINRKRHRTVDAPRSLRRNLDAQGGVKASETNSTLTKEKDVGVVENKSTSEISRGRRSRKESRVEICLGRSETSRRIKPPTTSSASSVGRMKVVVSAVQGESTTSSSSNMSTRDKTTSYFSMWNEALTDQVPKKRPVSGMMKPELSSVFYKFILSKANAIRAQGLQNEARQHAHDLLHEKLISVEVAQKAVLILKGLAKEERSS